jgi:tetratricopeptide (TPR) repeat protein
MNNPYRILGVSENASPEEIQRAYRDLAKKYHPDNFQDDTMKELAEEKMKEINEAYDFLTRRASGRNSYTESIYVEIRNLINEQNFSEAEIMLDSIRPNERGAEWNFLKGCVVSQRGWYLDAQKYFDAACNMDPDNREYRTAYESMRSTAQDYSHGYDQRQQRSGDASCCDCCANLICLDCLCECMGGDFIACC